MPRLRDAGVTINRPPRDGKMAFIRSPDNISIELLQKGAALPKAEPWASMPNTGTLVTLAQIALDDAEVAGLDVVAVGILEHDAVAAFALRLVQRLVGRLDRAR